MSPAHRTRYRHAAKERRVKELPWDVLVQIIGHLSIADLKSTRLCNKFLAQNAAGLLFHTLVVLFTQSHFDRLQNVAEHPILHHHVRCVIYAGNRLYPGTSKLLWRSLDDDTDEILQKAENNYDQLDQAYRKIANEQDELTRRGHDLFVWKNVLHRFVHLEDVRVLMLEIFTDDKGFLKPITDKTLSLPVADFEYDFASALGESDYQPMGIRQTVGVLCPILTTHTRFNTSPIRLKSLCLTGVSWKAFTRLHDFSANFSAAFSPLQHLEIMFLMSRESQRQRDRMAKKARETLRLLIKSARNLRTVSVAIRKMDQRNVRGTVFNPDFQLEHIFDTSMTWSCLACVEIRSIRYQLDALNTFVSKHKDSLRKLELTYTNCSTRPAFQDWESYVEHLGNMNTSQAESERGLDKEFTCAQESEPLYMGAHISYFAYADKTIIEWSTR